MIEVDQGPEAGAPPDPESVFGGGVGSVLVVVVGGGVGAVLVVVVVVVVVVGGGVDGGSAAVGVGAVVASGGGSTVGSVCVRLRPAGGARWWSLGLTAGFEVAGVVAGFA